VRCRLRRSRVGEKSGLAVCHLRAFSVLQFAASGSVLGDFTVMLQWAQEAEADVTS